MRGFAPSAARARPLRPTGLWLVVALGAGDGACHGEPPRRTKEESPPEGSRARQPGFFVWHELVATDPDAEAAFYVEIVGWRSTKDADGHVSLTGDFGEVAGVSRLPPSLSSQGLTARWIGRVGVEDVDATIAKTRLHGGQVPLEPMDLPDQRLAILEDPAGASMQVASALEPRPILERGRLSEFSWDELATPDGPAMVAFYGEVLGWKTLLTTPLGNAHYITLGRGDTPMAGIYADSKLRTQLWISYVQVADLDHVLSRATRRGATIIAGPKAVPGGRMAQLRDPEGALLGLRETSIGPAR
jgi:uncharacterized protein